MNLHIVIQIIFLIVSVSAADARSVVKSSCLTRCGDVSIPYPFGIGKGCYELGDWYEVTCNSITNKPFLSKFNLEILGFDFVPGRTSEGSVTVMNPVASNCERQKENTIWSSANFTGSPFSFKTSDDNFETNKFVVVGCDSALLFGFNTFGSLSFDDLSFHGEDGYGFGCLPRCETGSSVEGCQTLLPSFYYSKFYTISFEETKSIGCTYAFLIQASADMSSIDTTKQVPMVIYYYEDINPNETGNRDSKNYYSECTDCSKRNYTTGLGLGGALLSALLYFFCLHMYIFIKRKRIANLKKNFFKRNGGLLLEQHISSDQGTISKTFLFTSDELLKATNNYNENRILGQGGQGTVYKGMLTDGRITAVKKSNVIDESQLGQFINEVIILSQMDHRHIVKLLGCCLETEVPLLVYEFVVNGTLSDLIHNANEEFPFSWKMRLQIALEVAGALAYLHSASSVPIYHRDIKSTNILLDEKFRAKIADFGTSRSITIEQSHLSTAVSGTFGYLDPEYFQSSQFTDKSDVYSFGVVLAELLTGQKAVSLSESEEERSLAARFVLYVDQMRVFDIVDARVLEEAPKDDILAVSDITRRCLNLIGKMRPTMKEVTMALEVMSREPVAATPTILNQETFDIEIRRNRLEDHYSTSTMIMSDYEAFPSSETDPLKFYSH